MVGWWSLMASYSTEHEPEHGPAPTAARLERGRQPGTSSTTAASSSPSREEQIAAILDVIPDPGDGLLVDLCCGEGLLSRGAARALPARPRPRPRPLAGDAGARPRHRRARHGSGRPLHRTRPFDLADRAWRRFAEPVHAFVSSLAIHHLDGEGQARRSSATSPRRWRRAGPW